MNAKWNPAVFAIAWMRWAGDPAGIEGDGTTVVGGVSVSFNPFSFLGSVQVFA